MKNQVQPVCLPKDKIWSRTDKLQKMPLTTSEAGQNETNLGKQYVMKVHESEGVLIQK